MSGYALWQLGMHFRPSGGGADRYFDSLLKGFEEIGIPYTAAAFDGVTERTEKFHRVTLGSSALPVWKRRRAVRAFGSRFAADTSPKLIASHFALYAGFLPRNKGGGRHVVHFHGPWAEESAASGAGFAPVLFKRLIERRVYRQADHLITLSAAFRDVLIKGFGVKAPKVSVVPGAVDLEKFLPANDREVLRSRLGWGTGRRVVFCVRRLVARMGIAELIEAFASIAAQYPDVDLRVGGSGDLEIPLRDLVRRQGLEHRVLFEGFIPDAQLPDFYAASDLVIMPSQSLEGFGLVALEALASGVPVLVTPVGGLPEVVAGLGDSLVLEGKSPVCISRGLARALEHPGQLPSAGACRALVEKNHSLARIAGLVEQIYRGTVFQ